MKAFKTPIHGTGTFLLPLSIYVVVLMDFWPDVADKGQEVIQDFIPVLPEVGLKDGHLLLGVLLYFSAAAAMGSQSLDSGNDKREHQDEHLISSFLIFKKQLSSFSSTHFLNPWCARKA